MLYRYQSSLTFIWMHTSVPVLSSGLLSGAKYFLTSLLQGQKRGLHQFSNDESPFINSGVREGWRFAAWDKGGGGMEIIHHWHEGTQSKSLLSYWEGKKTKQNETLIVRQHFTHFVPDRLAEFISYVCLHMSCCQSVTPSPRCLCRSGLPVRMFVAFSKFRVSAVEFYIVKFIKTWCDELIIP